MRLKATLWCSTVIAGIVVSAPVTARQRDFAIPSMAAAAAVPLFAQQAGVNVVASGANLEGVKTHRVEGRNEIADALGQLLSGTGLTASKWSTDVYLIKGSAPSKPVAIAARQDSVQAVPARTAEALRQTPPSESEDGEVVVTARKRAENIRDVPVAITALSNEAIVQKNITQLAGLSFVVPNFDLAYGGAFTLTYVRGFGSGPSVSFEQSVGKFIDNVSYGRDQDARIPIFDIERLEVLKGPQVLTFGNSATAGAVNITTKKPSDTFEAVGSVGYEFLMQEINTQIGVNVPLADGVSVRVAGLYQDLGRGTLNNPNKNEYEVRTRNIAFRPSLRLRPAAADGLDIVLHAEVDRLKDFGSSIVPIGQPLLPNRLPYPVISDSHHRYVNYDVAPYYADELSELHAELYQADVNYRMLGGTLTSTSAWRHSDAATLYGTDGANHQTSFFIAAWQHYKQFSQELRFSGTYGRVDVTSGGYYQHDTFAIDADQEATLGGLGLTGAAATPLARIYAYDHRNRVFSGFVDATYRLSQALSISGGIRYTNNRKIAGQSFYAGNITPGLDFDTTRNTITASRNAALLPVFTPLFGPQHDFPFGSLRLDEKHWQPQGIIQYEFSPRNKAYLKFVRGAKEGGFDLTYSGTNPLDAGFKAEKATMFEAGAKGLLFENRLDYSLAIFRETFDALQQSAFNGIAFIVSNIGKARSQGVELELHYRPDRRWRIGLNGAYTDAKYLDFQGASCTSLQNAGLASGCVGTPPRQDRSGTPTVGSSKWSGSVSADYIRPIGDGTNKIVAGASVFARSKYNPGAYNDPRMEQKAYAQVDVHAEFGPADGRWAFSVFGRNLSDKRPLTYATLQPVSSTAIIGAYSGGRQIGVKLNFALQ